MSYAGFWRRFGAFWLDFIVYLPVIIFSVWLMSKTQAALTIWLLPGAAIGVWFSVYLVKRYGGTPGKLIMGLRIVRVDGSTIGYKEAILRYLPLFALALLMSIAYMLGSWRLSDVEYMSLAWNERQGRLAELAPSWYRPAYVLEQIWIWSEFVVMMTNKKRRALHDFLAGTVVVKVKAAPATEPAFPRG
ncbi:MAG: RDD family protein [Rhodoferax sp.]|nr:RDD family protein [Rhodoferax sp.]